MAANPTYTPEQKTRAIELYQTRGVRAAAQELGCSMATIVRWAQRAGVQTPVGPDKTAAATEGVKLRWAERRGQLADQLGDAAEAFLRRAVQSDEPKHAWQLMTALQIAIDKAQLLAGGATSRAELLTDPQARHARMLELRDELADKRARKARAAGQ